MTPDSPAGRSSAAPRTTPCLQVDCGSSEPKSFCRPAEGRMFGLLRPLPRLLLQRHHPADSARWRDTQRSRSLGPVRFQSGNREVNLDPLGDPARHGTQSRELLRRTASEAAARSPSRGAWVAAVTRVTAEGVAFHRQAGVRAHPGWAAGCRPTEQRGRRRSRRQPSGESSRRPGTRVGRLPGSRSERRRIIRSRRRAAMTAGTAAR
jgi:hypothetical protein